MSIISHKHLPLTIYWQCDHGIVLYLEPAAGTEMTKSWRHGLRISTFTPCPIVSRVNSRIASQVMFILAATDCIMIIAEIRLSG
jgi:hypothetical protein